MLRYVVVCCSKRGVVVTYAERFSRHLGRFTKHSASLSTAARGLRRSPKSSPHPRECGSKKKVQFSVIPSLPAFC